MHEFQVEGVSVTEKLVAVHGVWLMGATKRFQIVKVPIDLFTDGRVLEALCEAASEQPKYVQPVEAFLPLWE